ncbi:MAG: SDR family NAD(P)-dependent oxidoreductase [Burkholderiaceae bacterium]
MNDFQGKVAAITGAGSGFGREFALLGAKLGMRLALSDIEADALAATVAELQDSVDVASDVVDVADSSQVKQWADRTFDRFGAVHLLMNNAGVGGGGYLWENTDRDWQWVLGVNLMGVVHGVQQFVPRMLEANRTGEPAYIVNTASIAGWLCPPLMGVYNVSKHAVVALSETLFHDLQTAGSTIGVSVLCPAFVPTGIAHSHRNRPTSLSNDDITASQRKAQSAVEKAVSSGKMTAPEVAQLTFDAVRANRFYVFTHPQILPAVQARFDAVISGGVPADPYATRPTARPQAESHENSAAG